jgi:iron(III) transport system ATP-binding protein
MAISDRIAVMSDGIIQHVGKPQEIYHRPKNRFVATFIGRTDFINANYHANEKRIKFGDYSFAAENLTLQHDAPVLLSVRPEDLILSKNENSSLKGVVKDSFFLGLNTHQLIELDQNQQLVEVISESSLENLLRKGEKVSLEIKGNKINIFSEDGTQNLMRED